MRWFLLLALGCTDVGGAPVDDPHDQELITTVELGFTMGSTRQVFVWGGVDGGAPVIDAIALAPGVYGLDVRFLNAYEEPPEDLTEEVRDEGTEHQVFFTGSVVDDGSWVVAYDDADDNGLAVGLANEATVAGTGELTVTLRHMPPQSGEAVKVAGLADDVAANGLSSIGGDSDVSVTFPVEGM